MEELRKNCAGMDSICGNAAVVPKSDQRWRIVLATVLPSIFIIIIMLCLIGIHIEKRKARRIGIETLEVPNTVPDVTEEEYYFSMLMLRTQVAV